MTHYGNHRDSIVPNDDAATEQAAHDLCEAARTLNHVTAEPTGLAGPATVYGVLDAIATVASRFDQTLQQLDQFLSDERRERRLVHDHGVALDEVMDVYGRATLHARHLTSGLSEAARQAQNSINFVHRIVPTDAPQPPIRRVAPPAPPPLAAPARSGEGASRRRAGLPKAFRSRGRGA